MNARILFVCLALGAAACGKKSAPSGPAEEATRQIVAFRDRACACTDVACSQQIKTEMTSWMMKEGPALSKLKFSEAQNQAGDKASKEMAACIEKLEKAERAAAAAKAGLPSTTPDPAPTTPADPRAPTAPPPNAPPAAATDPGAVPTSPPAPAPTP